MEHFDDVDPQPTGWELYFINNRLRLPAMLGHLERSLILKQAYHFCSGLKN